MNYHHLFHINDFISVFHQYFLQTLLNTFLLIICCINYCRINIWIINSTIYTKKEFLKYRKLLFGTEIWRTFLPHSFGIWNSFYLPNLNKFLFAFPPYIKLWFLFVTLSLFFICVLNYTSLLCMTTSILASAFESGTL